MRIKAIGFFSVFFVVVIHGFAQIGGLNGFNRADAHMRYLHKHYDEFSEHKKVRLKRYYAGATKPFMSFDISQHYVAPGFAGYTPPLAPNDASVETTVSGGKSWGNFAGSFFPLYYTTTSSAVGFDVAFNGEFFSPNVGPVKYGEITIKDQGDCMLMSFPISLAYKSGGEVSMSKHDKILFSFGGGLAPTIADSKILVSHIDFSVRRFVMMEFGMFTKIAWKFRAMYYTGNFIVLNKQDGDLNSVSSVSSPGQDGTLSVKVIGSGDFNVSLIFFPFSYKWDN